MPSTCMHYGHILFYVCANLGISFFPIGEVVGDYVTSPVTDHDYIRQSFHYMNDKCIEDSAILVPEKEKTTYSLFIYRPVTLPGLPIYHLLWMEEIDGKLYWRSVVTVNTVNGEASESIYDRSFWLPFVQFQAEMDEANDILDGYHFHLALYEALQDPEKHPEDRFAQMILTENGSKVDFF